MDTNNNGNNNNLTPLQKVQLRKQGDQDIAREQNFDESQRVDMGVQNTLKQRAEQRTGEGQPTRPKKKNKATRILGGALIVISVFGLTYAVVTELIKRGKEIQETDAKIDKIVNEGSVDDFIDIFDGNTAKENMKIIDDLSSDEINELEDSMMTMVNETMVEYEKMAEGNPELEAILDELKEEMSEEKIRSGKTDKVKVESLVNEFIAEMASLDNTEPQGEDTNLKSLIEKIGTGSDEEDLEVIAQKLEDMSRGDIGKHYVVKDVLEMIDAKDGIDEDEKFELEHCYDRLMEIDKKEIDGKREDIIEDEIISDTAFVTKHYVAKSNVEYSENGKIPFALIYPYDGLQEVELNGEEYIYLIPSFTGAEVCNELELLLGEEGTPESFNNLMKSFEIIDAQNEELIIVEEDSPLYLLETGKGTEKALNRLAMVYLNAWYPYFDYTVYSQEDVDGIEYIGIGILHDEDTTLYFPSMGDKLEIPEKDSSDSGE